MDMVFVVINQLPRPRGLRFGSCISAPIFAPRILRTLPRGNIALCYPSSPSDWDGISPHKLPNMLGSTKKKPAPPLAQARNSRIGSRREVSEQVGSAEQMWLRPAG